MCLSFINGSNLSRIGADEREMLEYVPSHFKAAVHVQPKMSCRQCETITRAPIPSLPIDRGRPSPALLAHVLVAKYSDHLPLYRQSVIYARAGVSLDRSTLADWVGQAAALLEPLARAIARHVETGITRMPTTRLTRSFGLSFPKACEVTRSFTRRSCGMAGRCLTGISGRASLGTRFLNALLRSIPEYDVPIAVGYCFGDYVESSFNDGSAKRKRSATDVRHALVYTGCLNAAERYMGYAAEEDEVAMAVAEDVPKLKKYINGRRSA